MNCLDCDIKEILQDSIFKENRNGTYLITGATGFLGSYCVKVLMEKSKQKNADYQVIALVRNKEKALEKFREYTDFNNFFIIHNDFQYEQSIKNTNIDYIIHTAGSTHKEDFEYNPTDTIRSNLDGIFYVLKLSKLLHVKKLLVLSTAQIYGNTIGEYITENNVSGFDPFDYRACYAESKRMMETLCASYAKQYGINVNIARLFHAYGPGNSLKSGTFFSEFMLNSLNGTDIILTGDGSDIRNLGYITDITTGLFYILYNGISGEAYNVGNENENISIIDFAYTLAELSSKNCSVMLKKKNRSENTIKLQKPSMKKLNELGWNSKIEIKEGLQRLLLFYEVYK